jgi:hypothetical protein
MFISLIEVFKYEETYDNEENELDERDELDNDVYDDIYWEININPYLFVILLFGDWYKSK